MAEYECELIIERVNAGVTAARESSIRFGRPAGKPGTITKKLAIVADARSGGRTAAEAATLVGWSRATLHQYRTSSMSRTHDSDVSNSLI